ncbi:hypothetical protein WPG_1243 [Winogradskyella sp. PG-2]|nr:hypothetical protein WPG_1243 [Winogradskyella sp. PG-2]
MQSQIEKDREIAKTEYFQIEEIEKLTLDKKSFVLLPSKTFSPKNSSNR